MKRLRRREALVNSLQGSAPRSAEHNIPLSQNDKQHSVALDAVKHPTKQPSPQNEVDFLTNHKSTDTEFILQHTTNVAHGLAAHNQLLAYRLAQQNSLVEHKLDFLVQEASQAREARIQKEARKAKRRAAIKQKTRDALTTDEFQTVLSIVNKNTYKAARIRVALLIMYFTGLRVSNLLKLTVSHINNLLLSGTITLPILKKGPSRHFLAIGKMDKKILQSNMADITLLSHYKKPEDFFFTPEPKQAHNAHRAVKQPAKSLCAVKQPTRQRSAECGAQLAISREQFDRDLNDILKKASLLLGKHLRTHSFRATFITDLLDSGVPIQKVQDIVGHNSIKSTAYYQRSFVGKEELKKIIGNVSALRANLLNDVPELIKDSTASPSAKTEVLREAPPSRLCSEKRKKESTT